MFIALKMLSTVNIQMHSMVLLSLEASTRLISVISVCNSAKKVHKQMILLKKSKK